MRCGTIYTDPVQETSRQDMLLVRCCQAPSGVSFDQCLHEMFDVFIIVMLQLLCEMDNSAIVLCCMRVAFYMEWSAVLTTVPRDAGSNLPGPCPGPAPPGGGEETIDLDLLMSIIYRGTVYFTLLRSLVGWCVC